MLTRSSVRIFNPMRYTGNNLERRKGEVASLTKNDLNNKSSKLTEIHDDVLERLDEVRQNLVSDSLDGVRRCLPLQPRQHGGLVKQVSWQTI